MRPAVISPLSRDKTTAALQTTYSNSLQCVIFVLFWFTKVPINYMSELVYIMAWRWLGDKPLSGPTRDNYWYHFTNSDLLYIWCPRVDVISLINRRPPHSKGNHSPHGLYTHLSEIHNFGVKLITGLCKFIWMVTPGVTPISGISILVRQHLYIETCPNNQTFGIKFNVFVANSVT